MREFGGNRPPAYTSHSRTVSAASVTAPSTMMMTPPMSPPNATTTSVPAMGPPPPRRPFPAHVNMSPMSPPHSRPVISHNRSSSLHHQEVPNLNPYAYSVPEDGSLPPPEYAYHTQPFDIGSDPASPVSPPLHPAFPLAGAGDESFFDRWLRYEAMGRPIFPGSRTGSSVATSDISSVRTGMFGSLPGGSRTLGTGNPVGPGSVASAGTRDRDNFTSSAPSYPSSRAGASRPSSRDGDVRSVNGESYTDSVISSEMYPPSLDARLHFTHPTPPAAPTPPSSSVVSSIPSSSAVSMFEREEQSSVGDHPPSPVPAATRPPRYSETTAGDAYRLDLAELINRGAVGYQTNVPILTYGVSASSEKAMLAEKLNGTQVGGGVVMVPEEVWQELRRMAGLDEGFHPERSPRNNAEGSGGSPEPRDELNRMQVKKRRREIDREAGCCGSCIIC